jgi:hypothetical protein
MGRVSDRRGTMLLVTLMILVAMASMGFVAAQKLMSEINAAGNSRKGALAFRVTEAAAFTALATTASLQPAGLMALMAGPKDPATGLTTLRPQDLAPAAVGFFDMAKDGSFGYEAYGGAGTAPALPSSFAITISYTGQRRQLSGYEIGSAHAMCLYKYQYDADGDARPLSGEPSDAQFVPWKRIRVYGWTPYPCASGPST